VGFIELTTIEGGSLWLVAGSIYAVEKPPREPGNWTADPPTLVKTASELFVVAETAERVIQMIQELFTGPEEDFDDNNDEGYRAAFGEPGFGEGPDDDDN
jgi:hypothetical protein